MPETYKQLAQTQPSTSAAAIYTPSSAAIIKSIRVVNTTSSSATITLYHKAGGAGTAAANMILPATTIDGNGFGEFEGTITLAASDQLSATASANSTLTVTIYGVEVS